MPSHSERVRRNYDPEAEPTGQRSLPSQPSTAPDWRGDDGEPVEIVPMPPMPLAHEDDSEVVEPNPI